VSAVRVVGGDFWPSAAERAEEDERRRAARILLGTPLLRRTAQPEAFRLVQRHASELRKWFEDNTGWKLVVDSQVIRLAKELVPVTLTGALVAGHHGARVKPGDAPFTRRRYVLFCLAAAALERSERQTTLGRLAEEVVTLATTSDLEALQFSFATREERADLAEAIKLLVRLGVLGRVSGEEEAYVKSGGDAVLYDIERRALSRLLAVSDGPSHLASQLPDGPVGIEQLERGLHPESPAYTDDERNRSIRRRLTRQLLEDPVVYFDELTEDERTYLARQRTQIGGRISEFTGLVAETRAEGMALVDPTDQLTDLRMPQTGTDGHVTLLIAEHLAAGEGATLDELASEVRALAPRYGGHWRIGARQAGAEASLAKMATAKLEALGLVRREGERVVPLPAIRRFRFAEARLGEPSVSRSVKAADRAEPSLFDGIDHG
jgi:uncharacterized protein (TIGR02678 family)